MKTITIDFTKTPAEISDKILGHQGEHNRTRLVITPPAEMAEDPNIISYAVCYQVGAHKVAHSEICDKADTITVLIERKVSKTNVISLQLEGYDSEENLLVLSDRITDLVFEPSATGEEYDGGNESALAEQVAYIKNKVENFEPTGSGGAVKKTITLDVSNVIIESASNDKIHQCFRIAMYQNPLPVNAVITNMRIKTSNSDLVDIKDIQKYTGTPIVINMNRIFYDENNATYIIAIIYTFGIANPIIDDMIGFLTELIEIDYYE